MQILPPDLVTDKQRYFYDLNYRFECDQEVAAERHERLMFLLRSTDTPIQISTQ